MGDSLAVTDHASVHPDNIDANHCSSLMPSDDLLVVKKIDDSGRMNDSAEIVEPLPSCESCSPSVDNKHEESRNVVVENGTVDEDSCSVNDCDASRLLSKIDDSKEMNDVDTGNEAEPLPSSHISRLCDNDHEIDLNLTVENHIDSSSSEAITRCCHEPDPPHSVTEKQHENVLFEGDCKCEQVNEACDANCHASANTDCSDVLNSATDHGDVDSELKVQDDSSSLEKHPTSRVTSEVETVNFEADDLPTTSKSGEGLDTGELGDAELHLECEDDGADTSNADSEKQDSGLTACTDAADEDVKSPPVVSTSTTDLVTSSAPSVSTVTTVAISTSLLSNLNVSELPARVPVVSTMLSTTSGATVTRPAQQNDKQPITVSVPSLAARATATTRIMSKTLQDIGLLLVSQKVFRNLASVQKQKAGESQAKCDTVLLQKLKASHQNLVAKNHGLLTAQRKCWCGYRSESKNVLEAHRLRCDFQGRCCYCHGEFVYRTQNQMKKHLWKVHRKIGHVVERYGSYACAYCPLNFSSRWSLLQHMTSCRRNFWLSANLAPKESDKDIPVFAAASKRAVVVTPAPPRSQVAQNSLRNTLVSSATLSLPSTAPPVTLQVTTAPRNLAPQLIQIGKQLFTFLPPTSSAISLNQSSVRSVSQMALNSTATQTAPNKSSSVPIVVNHKSTNQVVRLPATALHQLTVCPVCSTFVKDKTSLLIHMQVMHGSTHKMCQYCCTPNVTFPNISELNLHIARCHVSDCWICKGRFQPPDLLINHIADKHKVTMRRMLELRRCYFCSSVPGLPSYLEFEEHMMKLHSVQFADIGKLWDRILFSQNADRNWYAKRNADGTLECPHCRGQFISASFLFRHLHLEHNGVVVRLVYCRECGKCMPSNILDVHLIAAHTRKCSVRLSYLELPDHGCLFIPPVGTKRLKSSKRLKNMQSSSQVSNGPPLKRVRTVETVIISDDDSSDEREYIDDSSDEDFVVTTPIVIEPRRQRMQRTVSTRLDRRNSSVDDVHEVLASIVDSSESKAVSERPVSFRSTPISSTTVAAAQLCNGITEDEVEIIESIVPVLRDRSQHQPAGRSERVNHPVSGHYTANGTTADEIGSDSGPVCAASDKTDVELVANEDSTTKPRSGVSELMARDQIMMDNVKEVLDIDGDTVLVVHGDDEDDNDDDDDE